MADPPINVNPTTQFAKAASQLAGNYINTTSGRQVLSADLLAAAQVFAILDLAEAIRKAAPK